MSSDSSEPADPQPRRRWHSPLGWSVLLFAAWLLYELTRQPALAIVTICFKIGWNDFLTALWLWKRDPNRRRAKACFWLHLGAGLLKTALAAIVPIYLVPIIDVWQAGWGPPGQRGGMPSPQLIAAIIVSIGGFSLCALATAIAVLSAWRHGTRLWLNRGIHRDRRENNWPPLWVGWPNRLRLHLNAAMGTIAFIAISTFGFGLALVAQVQGRGGVQREPNELALAYTCLLGSTLVSLPIILLIGSPRIQTRIIARTPLECWPEAEFQDLTPESWPSEDELPDNGDSQG
jgi:hypothetical protein